MEQIVRADIAAFGAGRAEMANAMIEQSGMRVRRGPQARPRGRHQSVRPLRAGQPRMSSTMAGTRSRNCRRSRPRCRSRSRARSSPATNRPTFPSTARSIPIAAASMAASTASRGRRTAYMGLSPGLDFESKLFAKPDAAQAARAGNCRRTATSRARSPSAPTPIPTSRSRSSGGSCARSSKCWKRAIIRSASSPSRRW